ncbi:alpha/beta-hydrolase, partial [Violaceomyces palustris]
VSTSILFQAPRDAPFSVAEPLLSASLVCPNGIQRLAGGIVLLVHGTGATGDQSWPATPFLHLLPAMRPGFDVCYINIPGRSQGDIQLSSEYVAYNIMRLAEKSVTRNVSVIGHSQGNLNIQWALTFWPSIRPLIQDYIAVAADFHGTLEGSLACTLVRLREEGCTAALLQQTSGSNFLKALLARGDKALVTTTSIYTLTDDVIQNEVGPNATSILPGAANYFLQQIKICGPSHVEGHISVLFDPAVFHLAFDAITHVGPASLERFDRRNCFGF